MKKSAIAGLAAGAFGGIMMLAATAQAASCSGSTLGSAYSFRLTGTVERHGNDQGQNPPFARSPYAAVGIITGNGSGGGLGGELSFSDAGKISSSVPIAGGSVAVNANCTGTLTIEVSAALSLHFDIAIEQGGAGMVGIETDPDTVATFVAHE